VLNRGDNVDTSSVKPVKTKSSTKAKNKYYTRNYDSVHVFVPKGQKSDLLAVAEASGDSLNGYITKAIKERIAKNEKPVIRTYTIIGGINGTGKSSFTGVLKTQTDDLGEIIDVDKITADNSITPLEGGKTALRKINEFLIDKISFTQETTLAGKRTEITASKAKESGYFTRLYYIGLDTPEECLNRISNRVARGGHNINENDVRRRFAGRWESLSKILPYCDEVQFFDNDNGFAYVAEYKNGQLIFKTDTLPKWLAELSGYLINETD